jgi:DNA-binding SARP family transcriptional activator
MTTSSRWALGSVPKREGIVMPLVRLLGPVGVSGDDRSAQRNGFRARRSLLYLLALHPRPVLAPDRLMELL